MDLFHTAYVPAGDGPFPAVVALHGWGANAHDLLGLAPLLHGGRALVLCPQGSFTLRGRRGEEGYGWFRLVPGVPTEPAALARSAAELRGFLDRAVERYPVDPRRIVPLGFSQGGLLAYELGLRDPGRFAGLAALSASLPEPVAQSLPRQPEHEDFPVLVVHGTRDRAIDVERARASRERLRPLGVALTYRELEMGHEIAPEALRVLDEWLSQRAFKER